jgi:hypothetical protein
MSDHHARPARDDLYDHEHEEPRSTRRRRPVADWGVGDDMFEHMPRNRFARTAEAPPRERRFAREDDRRAHHDEEDRSASELQGDARVPEAAPERGPAEDPPRGGVDDGRRTLRIGKDEDVPSEIAAITADRDIPADVPPVPTGEGVPERRTVKIGGRPEGSLEAARYQRDRARRPPRTAHERIGARPDRIAMWAFALGLLLIAIAILTAM